MRGLAENKQSAAADRRRMNYTSGVLWLALRLRTLQDYLFDGQITARVIVGGGGWHDSIRNNSSPMARRSASGLTALYFFKVRRALHRHTIASSLAEAYSATEHMFIS